MTYHVQELRPWSAPWARSLGTAQQAMTGAEHQIRLALHAEPPPEIQHRLEAILTTLGNGNIEIDRLRRKAKGEPAVEDAG